MIHFFIAFLALLTALPVFDPGKDPATSQRLLSRAGRGRKRYGVTYQAGIIVIHIQEGLNDLPSYFAGILADSTFWVTRVGEKVRMMFDTDEVWTNGDFTEPINHTNRVIQAIFNLLAPRGINSNVVSLTIENQGFAGQEITDVQYQALAEVCAYWCTKFGWPADREHIVGHYEIGEHKGCPGKAVSLERLVKMTQQLMNTPQPTNIEDPFGDPNTWHCTVTDKWVVNEHGFLDQWRRMGGLPVIGYPLTGLRVQAGTIPDPKNPETAILEQYFERARFEYHRDKGVFMLGLVGSEALAANIAAGKATP
ncbi:MAG: N-acetylmuramoyl-L-alanine amidase [Chloroflexi bacterium]|nr:N-acetylmuramoyl-L-alanine amidase [Chloroflexota bacterium]OJW05603.1 MAG: hypothetical protein BGO39_03020 [Chloroflexi bacterium 54-19]